MAIEHSEKGLETLAQMATAPTDWGLAEIKWVKREIEQEVWIPCPKCEGRGALYNHKGWRKASEMKQIFGEYINEWTWTAKGGGLKECDCPYLPPRRTVRYQVWGGPAKPGLDTMFYDHFSRHDRGLVKAVRQVVRTVGIVQWHKDTKFDSRFRSRYGVNGRECELCAKSIPSGRFVPVTGKGANGVIHGAWIGEDCARKFFGIKNFKKEHVVLRDQEAA